MIGRNAWQPAWTITSANLCEPKSWPKHLNDGWPGSGRSRLLRWIDLLPLAAPRHGEPKLGRNAAGHWRLFVQQSHRWIPIGSWKLAAGAQKRRKPWPSFISNTL